MKSSLVRTDTVWYKIKSFFKSIFSRKDLELSKTTNDIEIKRIDISNIKADMKNKQKQMEMAEKILSGEFDIYDLSKEEVLEMKEYFTQENNRLDIEINRVKNNIINYRNKINET